MIKRIFKILGILGLLSASLPAQQGNNVVISQGPPIVPYQKLLFYNGSNLLEYICTSNSVVPEATLSVSTATRANPGVFTSAAHGFDTHTRPRIRFTGTMPTGWSSLSSGYFIVIPIDANTFSLATTSGTAVDTSGFSNAWSGTASFRTSAPRTNQTYWSLQWLQYDGSSNLVATLNAFGGTQGTLVGAKCDDRASTGMEWK